MKPFICLLLALPAFADCWRTTDTLRMPSGATVTLQEPCGGHALLYASAAALIVSQAADGITTERALNRPGTREANPLGLQGAVALKGTTTIALLSAEWLLRNHRRAAKVFSVVNLGLSVEFGSVALHNSRLR